MPETCKNYGRDLQKLCQRRAKIMPENFKNYARDLQKLCQRRAKIMPEICRKFWTPFFTSPEITNPEV